MSGYDPAAIFMMGEAEGGGPGKLVTAASPRTPWTSPPVVRSGIPGQLFSRLAVQVNDAGAIA